MAVVADCFEVVVKRREYWLTSWLGLADMTRLGLSVVLAGCRPVVVFEPVV